MHAIIIVVLILAILLVIFTLQNSFEVSINVFFWEINNAPLVLVLLCCILLGYLIAAIYFYPNNWKLKRDYKKAVKTILRLEKRTDSSEQTEKPEKTGPEGIEMDKEDEDGDKSFFRE
jgi:lipopolysaccharide assembly protein A